MSKLSERCRQHLEMNGYTVYTFAKNTGLDRASIHRLVSGLRLPSKAFLSSFCDSLRINARDRREILNLYEEEKSGAAVYQNREHIKKLLSEIMELDTNKAPLFVNLQAPDSTDKLPLKSDTLLQTTCLVFSLLERAFASVDTNMPLLCNLPPDSPFPISIALNQYHLKYRKKICFKHLFFLIQEDKQDSGRLQNLQVLRHVLPLALSRFETYLPYFSYCVEGMAATAERAWPYYLITDMAVLVISSDMTKSICIQDPAKIIAYRQEMENAFSKAKQMMQITHTPEDAASLYKHGSDPCIPLVAFFKQQPCLTSCIPEETVLSGFQSLGLSSYLTSEYLAHREPGKRLSNTTAFFSWKGLKLLWETGRIVGQATACLPPLTVADRRKTLETFIQENGKTMTYSLLLKETIAFPDSLYFELLADNQVFFCMLLDQCDMRFAILREPGIYQAFLDFVQYLSDHAYTLEETNQIVRRLLDEKPMD